MKSDRSDGHLQTSVDKTSGAAKRNPAQPAQAAPQRGQPPYFPLSWRCPGNLGTLDKPATRRMEPTERSTVARILDANANRAREALRVVEDHCRYALDDAYLSRELKGLRHGLTEALATLPGNLLLAARDTVHDVGTQITTADEYQRHSTADVVRANWNRLREALRTLEEYGKTVSPDLGRALEQLRYRCYTLERVIVLGMSARQQLEQARLYVLVTEAQCPLGLERTIREAAAGKADTRRISGVSKRAGLAR